MEVKKTSNIDKLNRKIRELQESEERYQLAVAGSAAGIWDWDIINNELYTSERLKELWGFPPYETQITMDDFWDRLHPEDSDTVKNALEQHLKNRVTYNIEYRIQTKSGEYLWFHARGQALWNEAGEAIRMSGSLTDITDRKLADEALRQSKEFNQSLLDSLPDHITVLDSDGTIVSVNDAWTNFAMENDVNIPESVGPGVNYLMSCRKASDNVDETVAKSLNAIQSVIDGTSERFEIEYPCDSPTEKRWFLMRVIPFTGPLGRAVVIHKDITSRKLAEEELKRSEERFRRLMEFSPIGISIWSLDGKISQVNEAWKKLWGLSEEETAKVMASYNFLTDKQLEKLGQAPLVARAFKGEHIIMPQITYEANRTTKNIGLEDIEAQSRTIQVHIYPVKDAKEEIDYVVAINMDLTELKKAEQEVQVQREALARVDRATRMGQLTGSIAHELNQPLTGILGNAQAAEMMLKSKKWKREDYVEIIADIIADTKRAGDVIRNLRELYREHKGEYTPVDINSVAEEAIKLMHSEFIMKQVEIISELDPSIPLVNGNKFQLQQVLVNLIMNGEQAMSNMAQDDRKLHIATTFDEYEVKLWVDDFGPGIEEDKIDRIFEPLETWKPGGTGMGLAISNSIIKAHGGKIWAENRSEGGAQVGFTLPVIKKDKKK